MNSVRLTQGTPLLSILKLGIILCWLGWAIFYSLNISIHIPTTHMDGAFQTASALHRLDAGQVPGRDFYPYLGVGPVLTLFPFFKLFGANIAASVFSAHLTVLIFVMLSIALICHLMWRPKSYLTSLAAGTVLFSASIAPVVIVRYLPCVSYPDFVGWGINLPNLIEWGLTPGNSLRPLRSIAPYLTAYLLYFAVFRIASAPRKYICAGVLTGFTLLWSNDYAIPTAGLLLFAVLVHSQVRNELRKKNVFLYFGSSILSWVLLLSIVTLGHPLQLLQYNFFDVAQEQWWFFGPYGEGSRINSIQDLSFLFSAYNSLSLFVLGGVAVLALRTRLVEHALLLWIGVALFAGGVVSSVGGHMADYYFHAFQYWGMVTAIAGLARMLWLATRRFASDDYNYKLHRLFAALCISILLMITSYSQYRVEFSGAKNAPNRFFVPELGGYLGNEWSDYIKQARGTADKLVIEEYWGLWSATQRKFPPWPVDSVIHALGHTRELARESMQHADIVISTKYSNSPPYQPWNLSQSYWFYENLLKEWSVFQESPTTVVWHRDKNPRPVVAVNCTVNANSQSLDVQVAKAGFYEIGMLYKLEGSGRAISMIKNNISYGDDANGYVSINPKGTYVKFPAYLTVGQGNLDTIIMGNKGVKFNISACTANHLSFRNEHVLDVKGPVDFYITDGNWTRGISLVFPGFFVPNLPIYSEEYIPEKIVRLINGEERTILRSVPMGGYLHVIVSGGLLDASKVGVPNQFIVLNKFK